MGTCTQFDNAKQKKAPSIIENNLTHPNKLWLGIEKYNFDTDTFKLAKSIQESLADIDGTFIQPHRVARLMLEFK